MTIHTLADVPALALRPAEVDAESLGDQPLAAA